MCHSIIPPKLVIYAPSRAPAEDPLEELRAAGGSYVRRLSTLAKDALKGQLSEQRLAEIGSQARTLVEAEAAVGGDTSGGVRLIGVLGASDARTMTLRGLTGERSADLGAAGAWPAAAALLDAQVGGTLTGSDDELRRDALRQMVLTEISAATDGLPESLASAFSIHWAPRCGVSASIASSSSGAGTSSPSSAPMLATTTVTGPIAPST